MSEPIPVKGQVLVWARRSATATVEEAAERTEQSVATIRDWEAERAQPSFAQLERLADEYGVSYNALLLPEPPSTPEPPPDFRSPSGRREPISRRTRRELRRARYLQRLVADAEVLPPTRLLPADLRGVAVTFRETMGISLDEQLSWRDSHEAFRSWRSAVTRLGILVVQFSLPIDELRGMSIPASDGRPPVIVVNQSDFINARNFTVLHEVGHLVLARDGGICDPWRQVLRLSPDSLEARCNDFAGSVLVPASHLREQPEAVQAAASGDDEAVLELLRVLARRYRVSTQVIWYRLRDLQLVSAERFSGLWPRLRPPTRQRPRQDEQRRGGISRSQRARSSYGPDLLSALFSASDRGALAPTTLMRALNVGTGDLARLQGQSIE